MNITLWLRLSPKFEKWFSTKWLRVFDEAGIDGVAELWFDTREDFDAAYATEIGKGHNTRIPLLTSVVGSG